jgi:hypothetical protein
MCPSSTLSKEILYNTSVWVAKLGTWAKFNSVPMFSINTTQR